eukprot:TRINITY_DN388_c0_g3_i1.p1 TRINITY_DN388_c0_g3~~TRINITY_DN388_c0_g3_i1.p1  ORF type:complete len:416 (+),score=99.76 TRINITY_DN388_c0_g3_i1:65-1312(+)
MCIRDRYQRRVHGDLDMEARSLECIIHQARLNELFCKTCKVYMCARCISGHDKAHASSIVHILHYTPTNTLPKIDSLIEAAKEKEKEVDVESKGIVTSLQVVYPEIRDIMLLHDNQARMLKTLIQKLAPFSNETSKERKAPNIAEGLLNEKKKLEGYIKEKKVKEALQLAFKIENEAEAVAVTEPGESLVKRLHAEMKKLKEQALYKDILSAANLLMTKCQLLKIMTFDSNWTIDKTFQSTKMFLSEDNLTYGCTSSNGYPGIIGTANSDNGSFAFEVIPTSLCCSGKEGFGIVERDRYIEEHKKDNVTPTIHTFMMGYTYKNEVRNMTKEEAKDLEMGKKYYVKCNVSDLKVTITGPGVKLSAELKPGVAYAPALSCGCSGNRIKIRPLASMEEEEEKQLSQPHSPITLSLIHI